MRPWERRLRDLSQILSNCEDAYFDPNLFRMNTNHFLQTSRTVTFIIQKEKSKIPSFDSWYEKNILSPWSNDLLMIWAKDSRNKIEKEGDLDLHSSLNMSLIFSYLEDEDIRISCNRSELVSANIKRLIRFARAELPSGISDASVIRIERTWIANSLPDWELINALRYIYSCIYKAVVSLGRHIKIPFDIDISPIDLKSSTNLDSKRTSYVKLNDLQLSRLKSSIVQFNSKYVPPSNLADFLRGKDQAPAPRNIQENVERYAKSARHIFEHFGNHIPMLMMFDDEYKVIELTSVQFDDQATKYLFWRSVADRLLYIKPSSIIFICESWNRTFNKNDFPSMPIRKLPIIGESLHVVCIDSFINTAQVAWKITREPDTSAPPKLQLILEPKEALDLARANFFEPIRKAFLVLLANVSKV